MSERAKELAQRFAQANAEFVAFIAAIPAAQWGQIIGDGELRSVGMVAYHVTHGYAVHQRYFGAIAAGQPLPPLTPAEGDTLNATFAQEGEGMTQVAVLEALRSAAVTATAWIGGLSDEQLNQRGVYLVSYPALTVDTLVEHGFIGHHAMHLKDIRAALQR